MLSKVDPRQFGTWNSATDGYGAAVRVLIFEFKKAFDLIDHQILVGKLCSCDIPDPVISWIIDFLTSRNSELNLAMTASRNGVLYRRGFPKAQKFGAMAVCHDNQRH